MIRSLWIAKTGMEAQQMQLDTISHNLANVGTNGFKRGHVVFEDLIYQNLRQAGVFHQRLGWPPVGSHWRRRDRAWNYGDAFHRNGGA